MPIFSPQTLLPEPGRYLPAHLSLGRKEFAVANWSDVLATVARELLTIPRFRRPLIAARQTDTWLARRRRGMLRPHELEHHVWIDLNGNPRDLWQRIRTLLEICNYPFDRVAVDCYSLPPPSAQKPIPVPASPAEPPPKPTTSDTRISAVLSDSFPNGIRPGSIIDRNKFAAAWRKRFDEEMPKGLDLEVALPLAGMVHGDKVFPVGDANGTSPAAFVKSLEERSHGIFFYDELFEKEADAFTRMGIQSGEMLRALLRKESPDAYVYGKSTFTLPGFPHAVADVIAGVFSERPEWSRETLEERLPFVPSEKIASVLATNARFIRVSEGTYRLLSGILLDEEECRKIVRAAEEEISRKGFFSLASASFERSLDQNGDILLSAVQAAFSERFLSADFDRHGKIVCAKGAAFDSRMAVRAFCRENDEATMEELLQLERDFGLGGGNRSIETAHEEMVRVSENRFVSPRLVPFDPAGVDAALESIVPSSGVMPLVSLRSFVSFPPVPGWEWNAYLLESFLRRESAAFAFLSVSAAPRTACGAVVRKSAGFASVVDAFARAVADAGISPTEKIVGDFLMSQGFIQRRRGVEKEVAEAARRLKNNISNSQ